MAYYDLGNLSNATGLLEIINQTSVLVDNAVGAAAGSGVLILALIFALGIIIFLVFNKGNNTMQVIVGDSVIIGFSGFFMYYLGLISIRSLFVPLIIFVIVIAFYIIYNVYSGT